MSKPLKYQKNPTEYESLCDYFDCRLDEPTFKIDGPKIQIEKRDFHKQIKNEQKLKVEIRK